MAKGSAIVEHSSWRMSSLGLDFGWINLMIFYCLKMNTLSKKRKNEYCNITVLLEL